MSLGFSANQYEGVFKSNRLQNWTLPKQFKERPSAAKGHTNFIATDRGHLFPGVKRGSARTAFQGTWDLPNYIPPVHINQTARSEEGQKRLKTWAKSQKLNPSAINSKHEADGKSKDKSRTDKNTHADQLYGKTAAYIGKPQIEMQRSVFQASQESPRLTTQQSQRSPRSATPQSQRSARPASRNTLLESRPITQQDHVESRPISQQNQESRPVTQASKVQSRPATKTSKAAYV